MGIFTFNNLLSAVKTNGLSESFLPPMILNMSITASVIILFVLLARLALKKAPKIFSYALWAVVLFRLLCPVSITTDFSLLGLFDTPAVENTQHTTAVEYIPYDVVHTPDLEVQLPVPPAINDAVNNTLPQKHAALGADPLEGEFAIGSLIWLLGIAAMAIYSAVSYILLRRKLVGSVLLRDNIYLADGIGSPFVMGFIRPKIYLPSALSEQEQGYIILHEQHHIRRGDHIIKALAFIALCIHWFNPLVWVAFVLSSKDMEMSCDEAVVKKLGEGIRADYSASLLSLATGRRIIAGTPLAFGEGDTKSRIKNMLNWKRAKPPVIFLATAAVILIVLICGTNASRDTNLSGNSWVDIKYNAREVELTCNLEEPIRSYAIYEDIYENGVLISSSPRIMDRFREDGGVTPRRFTVSLTVQSVYAETEEGFAGELNCTWTGVGGGNWKTALPKAHYTGSGQVFPEHEGKQKLDAEDSITLLMALLSTQDDGSLTMQSKDQTLMECNDTVVVYRLVTSSEGLEKYTTEENSSPVNNVYGTVNDVSYYLELAADTEFQNMNLDRQTSILVEYEDLLDDYTLIARESKDGTTAYIVGQYNGNPLESPLHGMYSIDMYTGEEKYFRFLYREDEVETVEAVVAANKTEFPPSAGYRIEDSVISWTENSGVILIQPKENTLLLDVPWNRYFYTPNGREYIADAVSRGIDVCGRTDTFLYVYRISERFGEIAERIALTEAEAQAILAEERVSITDGFGFSASLHIDGQTTYYNEREGIPQTVLDLAVEKCDYRFGDPSYITDTIREARLDCDWLDTTLYADEADLPRLREILKNAEHGYVGSCGYGAKLTLTFTGGEKLTVFKGCDGCDTIVFGSYGGYFLGEQENVEFWEMFGLDPDTKEQKKDLFFLQTGIQKAEAQEFYAKFISLIESNDKAAVLETILYPVSVTVDDGIAIANNATELLPYYDDIFTDGLLNSIQAGQLGDSQADLFTNDGLIGAANGAIWFVGTQGVMTIQNPEGRSLRPVISGITAEGEDAITTVQLSATEHAAAVDTIFANLRTNWWNGKQAKNCAYESAAFECLYREVNGNIVNLYGYGGYFRWDRNNTCVEHWDAPTIVTFDTETQQVLDLWWPGDGAAYESSILDKFPEEIAFSVAEPNPDRSITVRNSLMEDSKESMVASDSLAATGTTRRFGVQGLRLEISNVLSAHKTWMLAEGIEPHEYVVVSCTPESKITVLDAGMSDPTYAEDGKPHPQWGLLYTGETARTRITDETGTIPVTSDLEGIYNLEASLFVIQLNLVD